MCLFVADLLPHRLCFPERPRPLVASIFAGLDDLLSFLRIEVRDVAAQTDRLRFDACIDFQVNGAADNMADRRSDDGYAVTAHQHNILLPEYLGERATFLRIADQHIRHTE